jgi:hypothetical protein
MVVADDRLSEAEFECAARARTQKGYPWGDEVGENNAKCINRGSRRDNRRPLPGRLLCGESGWASMTCAATSGMEERRLSGSTAGQLAAGRRRRVTISVSSAPVPGSTLLKSSARPAAMGDTTADLGFRVRRAFITP